MRAVLDTNVVISALIWGGKPFELLQAAIDGDLRLITSPALMEELHCVLLRPHLAGRLERRTSSVSQALALYAGLAEHIDPPPLPLPISRDPDDDAVLALAVAAHANLVVSGDGDLLVLGSYTDIPIVTAAQALSQLDRRARNSW